MNIKKNNLFKKDFNYPLFSRVRIKSDMTFFFVLEQRTFLFNKKKRVTYPLNININSRISL